MPAPPLVSIHVVTFNQEAFIADTLTSAIEQDYANLEVVVADDGSRDATPAIVEDFARRHRGRVVALTGGKNLGITGNGNRCLSRCRGELIAFLAGDDLFAPGKVRAQAESFSRDERLVLSGHDVEHFDSESGARIRLHSAAAPLISGSGPEPFLRRGYPFATSSIMVRASALPPGGFDERLRICSDWKLAVDCLARGGRFGYVPGVLGRYRVHAGNITRLRREETFVDKLVGLAILEAERPELEDACREARAHAYYQRGVAALQRGDVSEARRSLGIALHTMPSHDRRVPAWWALTHLPAPIREGLVGALLERKKR